MRWVADQVQFLHATLAATREATSRYPDRASGWLALAAAVRNTAGFNAAAFEEARDVLLTAIGHLPNNLKIAIALVRAHLHLGEFDQAMALAHAALERFPEDQSARIPLLNLRYLVAQRECDVAAAMRPKIDETGYLQAFLVQCDAMLAAVPGHTDAVVGKARTLAKLGRSEEACEILSLDRHIVIDTLPVPEGYPDDEEFRKALTQEVLSNPTLDGPQNAHLHGLRQTSKLERADAPATDALLDQIKAAVEVYIAELPVGLSSFDAIRPRQARLSIWASIYGAAGRQISHHHIKGWLSGVYYVAAPRAADGQTYDGSLLLGALNPETDGEPPWGVRTVEPVPGRLVLFPSYVPHATEPSGVDGARISIAFDIVPIADHVGNIERSVGASAIA